MARNTRTFTDFNLLFSRHPVSGDLNIKSDEEAIKASLRNLISTKNYERPFHPEIGCQLFSMLFENFTPVTVQIMKKTVFDTVRKFEPRVSVLDVKIRDNPGNNRIDMDIIFKINNSDRPITLSTYITRVR
jgi:phage baseplate assembly protein W